MPNANPFILKTHEDICRFEQEVPFELRCPARGVLDLFAASALKFPDRTAITMVHSALPEEIPSRTTYQALLGMIMQAANVFSAVHGQARPGIAYLLTSTVETYVTLWAAEIVGYAVPINYLLSPSYIADLIKASGASILVACGPTGDFDIWEKANQVSALLPALQIIYVGDPAAEIKTGLCFHRLMETQPSDRLTFGTVGELNDIAAYFHTGGTTGAPKLVAHSHRNQIVAAFGGAVLADMTEDDVVLNGFPLFHVAGTIFNGLSCSMTGGEIVLLSPVGFRNKDVVRRYWDLAARYKATRIGGVPTVLGSLCDVPLAAAQLSSVRYGACGAASTPKAVAARFEMHTHKPLHEVLGMTETAGLTCIDPVGGERVLGSVGFRLPYTQIAIRKLGADGSLGALCAANEVGVLTISGPTVSAGYLDVMQNKGVFLNGQLNSGDLAYLDCDSRVFIVGRAKDLIIRSGHNIDPLMIEDVMNRHPSVLMAAAVAQPDAYAGELPVCYVVVNQAGTVTEAELRRHAENAIAERPAWPVKFYIIPEIPTTGVGKIFKPALRADAVRRLVLEQLYRNHAIDDATVTVDGHDLGEMVVRIALKAHFKTLIPNLISTFAHYLFKTEISILGSGPKNVM